MKIAQLISTYIPDGVGGAQICVHNVSRWLAQEGHEAAVVTTARKIRGSALGYEVVELPQWIVSALSRRMPFAKRLVCRYFERLQEQRRFDLWQVTMGYPLGIAVVDFFKHAGIPCVLRSSGEDIQKDFKLSYGYRLNPAVDRMVRKYYPRFDAFVSISKSMSDEYRALGIPDEKIHVISNGVDCARFDAISRSSVIHKKYGISTDKKIILTVGRNHPKKGYELIPKMIEKLLETRDDFVWIIIGRDTPLLREVYCGKRIRDRLITVEEVSADTQDATQLPSQELIAYYKNADVFVFPSYVETFGIVLIEAMAAGIPVVTTNASGCRDVVAHEINGLICGVGEVENLARSIERVLDNTKLQTVLVKGGFKTAGAQDWNIVAKKYMTLYASLICRK